nr:unnamed protein product [Callosobruchus analis]
MEQSVNTIVCNKKACQPKTCYSQPVMSCPWMAQQPHGASPGISRSCDQSSSRNMQPSSIAPDPTARSDRPLGAPSTLQTSSSHFFYFLRLMQLFPDTHPATLHTVLTLCKNDFFRAVDKLLYAKRCKTLYSRGMGVIKRCPPTNRAQPYRVYTADYPRHATLQKKKEVPTVNVRKVTEKEQEHVADVAVDKTKQHRSEVDKQEAPPAQPAVQCEVPDRESPLREEEKAMIVSDLSNMEKNVIDNNLDALENHDGFDTANGLKLKRDGSSMKLNITQPQEVSQECEVVCLTSSDCSQLVPGDKIIFM